MLGRPRSEAEEAFRRVLSYDPENAGALIHLARLASAAGDRRTLNSLLDRVTGLDPAAERTLELRALHAFAFGDQAARDRVTGEIMFLAYELRRHMVETLVSVARDPADAAELARRFTDHLTEPLHRRHAYLLRAGIELSRGRVRAARMLVDSLAAVRPARAREYRAFMAVLPLLPVTLDAIERQRSTLRTHPEPVPDAWTQSYVPLREFVLGLLAARAGDSATALRIAASMAAAPTASSIDSAYARQYAAQVRAQVALDAGRPADALRLLGAPGIELDVTTPDMVSYPKAHERYLRAAALHALGRADEALRWYETFPDPIPYDLMYLAPSHLRRAAIHAGRGEGRKAARHYARFLELWSECDPELQPITQVATAALARLNVAHPRARR